MAAGSATVKQTALNALKEHWLNAVIVSVSFITVYLLLVISGEFLTAATNRIIGKTFFGAVFVFMTVPLYYGINRFFWRQMNGISDQPKEIFYYFSEKCRYVKVMKMTFSLILRAVIFGFIIFLPSVFIDILSNEKFYELFNMPIPLWSSDMFFVSALFKAAGAVILFFVMMKYYAAPHLIIADENMDISEAIYLSGMIAGKSGIDFIFLAFSFIGWFFLSFFLIPFVFVMPYFLMSVNVHIRLAVDRFNNNAELANSASLNTYTAEI